MSTSYGPDDPAGEPRRTDHTGPHEPAVAPDDSRTHRDMRREPVDDGYRQPAGATEGVVLDREHEAYGGVKVGSAFFGWLVASAVTVLLLALLGAAGTAIGLANQTDVEQINAADAQTIGIVGGIVLLVVLFIAYFCGGYVAGRMARFDGTKQGLAVWLWALVIAVLVAVLGAVAGSQFDIFAELNAFPRIPINEGDLTTGGIIAAVLALLVTLGGALLGGASGTRYHRKVDHAGFDPSVRR